MFDLEYKYRYNISNHQIYFELFNLPLQLLYKHLNNVNKTNPILVKPIARTIASIIFPLFILFDLECKYRYNISNHQIYFKVFFISRQKYIKLDSFGEV